ncbi:MAG: hypothetical protein KBT68_07355 [bacterium]|nr:hypothetical protein [Candidatus Colisoma equi]
MVACALVGCLQVFGADRIAPKDQAPQQGDGTWWMNASSWSNAQVPNGAYDYILDKPGYKNGAVTGDFRLGGSTEAQNTFTGRSLQFGEVGGYAVSCILVPNNMAFGCANDGDLILASGKLASWAADNQTTILGRGGKIIVTAPESSPFWLSGAKTKTYWKLRAPLYGEAGTALKVYKEYANLSILDFALDFDGSNYNGTIIIGRPDGTRASPSYNGVDVTFGEGKALGGKLLVNPENNLKFASVSTDYHLGALEFAKGNVMTIKNNGSFAADNQNSKLTVSGACQVADGAKVTVNVENTVILTGWKTGSAGLTKIGFLTVPVGAAISKNDFITDQDSNLNFDGYKARVDIVEDLNGDGTKTISFRRRAYKQLEGNGAKTLYLSDDNSKFWWGDSEKLEGCDYFLKGADNGLLFETPAQESIVFGGASFTLCADTGKSATLQPRTKNLTISDLRIKAGCSFQTYNLNYKATGQTLYGELGLFADPNNASTRIGINVGDWCNDLTIASSIWGKGDIAVGTPGASRAGTLTLSGDNSRWQGGIKVSSSNDGLITLALNSSTSLGGALDSFRADALDLGARATLKAATDGIVLNETTRGVTVSAATAGIEVGEGKTLTINEKITYANGSVLTKKGAGVLVLGGAADVAGSAQIVVAEGGVQALSAAALAGVTLSCGENGAFVYSADGTTPVLIDPVLAPNSSFRMTVDLTAVPAKLIPIPVCELDTSMVAQFKSAFRFVKPIRGVSCMLSEESLGNGRVRIVANVGRFGLFLMVK